jgi:ATP-dependent exoDNAse (exonuclease V), alpha subunit - helicase superfamily I member
MDLDVEQQRAVDMCTDYTKRLVAVTGEAGTGKTTIIKNTCDILSEHAGGGNFTIAAPTGKAARRIREATGYPAQTIHKLLEFNRPDVDEETGEATSVSQPSRTRHHPLDQRIIIVDEYAMVSTGLHRDLVSAIPSGGCLRVFGDVRQLPPIENNDLADPTSPFQRCLEMPNTFTLQNIYRQAEGNGIIEAARRITRGQFFGSNPDVEIRLHDAVLHSLYTKLDDDKSIDWCSLDNQIISPARKSDIGTIRLNSILQARFNPEMPGKTELPRNKWEAKNRVFVSIGDKVVCNTNSYDLRDYSERFAEYDANGVGLIGSFIPCPDTKQMLNGEVGRILNIDEYGVLEIDFGDRVVELPPRINDYNMRKRFHYHYDPRKAIELAYALTTHKCQGSQYDNIIYCMASCAFFNLSRPNFYTGITRAAKHATILTDQRSFATSLKSMGWKRKKTT